MRLTLPVLAVLASSLAQPAAFACRELAVFPEHLELSAPNASSQYHMAFVKSVSPEAIRILITRSFGSRLKSGAYANLIFKPSEEAYAVCPIKMIESRFYLLRGVAIDNQLEISRYDGMNILETHPKFRTYIQDLESKAAEKSSAAK